MTDTIIRDERKLGAALRRVRHRLGLTQAAIGERIHIRQATVSRLEAGEPAVQLRTLMEVLAALDLELVLRPRTRGSAAEFDELF